MSNYDKIRITNRGKSVEIRDFKKGQQPAVPNVPSSVEGKSGGLEITFGPLEVEEVKTDVRDRNIKRLERMFGLGKYGHDLARDIVDEIWQDGFYHGIEN